MKSLSETAKSMSERERLREDEKGCYFTSSTHISLILFWVTSLKLSEMAENTSESEREKKGREREREKSHF